MYPDKKRFPEFHPRDPYFMPGYTGFFPRQKWIYGDTKSRASSRVMRLQPHIGGRLSPINFDLPSEHQWRAEGRLFGHIKERHCFGESHKHWLEEYDQNKWTQEQEAAKGLGKKQPDKKASSATGVKESDDKKQFGKRSIYDILAEKGYHGGRISQHQWSDGEKIYDEYDPPIPVMNQMPYGGGVLSPSLTSLMIKMSEDYWEERHRQRLDYQYQKRAQQMGFEWERSEDERHPNILRFRDYIPRQREYYYPGQAYQLIPKPTYRDGEMEKEENIPLEVTGRDFANGHVLLKEGYLPRQGLQMIMPEDPSYYACVKRTGFHYHRDKDGRPCQGSELTFPRIPVPSHERGYLPLQGRDMGTPAKPHQPAAGFTHTGIRDHIERASDV